MHQELFWALAEWVKKKDMILSLRAYTSGDVESNNKHVNKCNLKYSKYYEENKIGFCSSDWAATLARVASKAFSEELTTK